MTMGISTEISTDLFFSRANQVIDLKSYMNWVFVQSVHNKKRVPIILKNRY